MTFGRVPVHTSNGRKGHVVVNAAITVWTYSTVALAALLVLVIALQTVVRAAAAVLHRSRAAQVTGVRVYELPALAIPTQRVYGGDRVAAR